MRSPKEGYDGVGRIIEPDERHGFHNPTMARESLMRSISVSQDGIKARDEALTKFRAN
jgi:hypothetical protein